MQTLKTNLNIYKKFNFEYPPVAVKFTLLKPKGISKSNTKLALCERIGEAQKSKKPFYIDRANEDCVGTIPLGWEDLPPFAGYLGPKS